MGVEIDRVTHIRNAHIELVLNRNDVIGDRVAEGAGGAHAALLQNL